MDKSSSKKNINLDRTEVIGAYISGPDYFLNYELSWLQFNWRVLAQAEDPSIPLLERIKFIGIVCSNLDEFFQKRVGGLKRQLHAGVTRLSVDGRTPEKQLREVRKEVLKMIHAYRTCYFETLLPQLEKEGVQIVRYSKLSKELKRKAEEFFESQLYPIITPLAVDEAHPFPFISNKSRSLAIKLQNPQTGDHHFARIKIPSNRPRWITLKKGKGIRILVSISDIITEKIDRFFSGMKVESVHLFRVTRNADVERQDEEADDLLEMIEDELRERRFAEIVRLEIDSRTPADVKEYLMKNLKIKKKDIFEMDGPIGLADCTQLYDFDGLDHLKYEKWVPALHSVFRHNTDEELPDIFDTIRKGDFIVHHPYHSFELTTQRFIEEAAKDPGVLAIKQTLYRTSSDSPLMHSLIKAADDGKQVAVLVELKARFDEQRNITWAQKLEKAGVHVSYGISGLKIHSKMTMVVREERGELVRYVHIGTGNYHPHTAQLYEDLGYFTCDTEIAGDVTDVFNLLTGYAPDQTYKKLLVAPRHMRGSIIKMIDGEIEAAENGNGGKIIAKMNSLEDPLTIEKLYQASQAGVEIDLIVRGVCRLIPGKKGLSETIRVHSIIGRFLEHSRCFYFKNAKKHRYWIGSADWMHRNLDARVEVLTPIQDKGLNLYLKFLLQLYLRDNQLRWMMQSDGSYKRIQINKDEKAISVHEQLMDHIKNNNNPIPKSMD
ncbi:polyphosphate kinase 1 [Rhodohalobacter sp. SW132]|uniref:polyphosphate kinase 1 n=1 Tax=Rhodohalobacter sp. SW132 TaxID=2293433 RepID=UPI001F42E92A|nr:polyphosphate kinase 1 [Rhodohalobacter sp. SW132]